MIDEAVVIASALCRHFEGFYSRPYLDPIGIPTIGYGTIRYPDGRAVTLRDQLDTPGRIAALISWTHNLGAGNLRASTLKRRINARQWDDVPTQIMRWTRAGGVELRGLKRRRAAEAALI